MLLSLSSYHEIMEKTPDRFFRKYVRKWYIENIEAAARFVNAKPENCVLVENVTTGRYYISNN